MSKKLYEESNIQDIADAIREKNGEETTYKVSEMAQAILDIDGGTGDMPNLDDISFGNNPTVDNPGYTNPQYYEDIADAINYAIEHGGSLPETYDVLQYIDSDGTQAIDTGIKPHRNDLLAICTKALSGNDNYRWCLSCLYSQTTYSGIIYAAGVTRAYHGDGTSEVLLNTIDTENSYLHQAINNNDNVNENNAYLFAIKDYDGTIKNYTNSRLFFVIVGKTVLIPAKRKTDNVCGVLNLSSGDFLTDVSSGNPFSPGPTLFSL